jgi:hypothetical protein
VPTFDDIFMMTQIGVCTDDTRNQFTGDISIFYEIESAASIGGCITATTTATTTKLLLFADLFGGG